MRPPTISLTHLKTASVVTNSSGTITEDEDYYPWGGEIWFVNSDPNHYKFTGKERDTETGLDYFGARYYGNWTGRFLSADWSAKPEPVPYADLGDPQSLNLYSYVRNIPTSKADADGHCYGLPGPCPEVIVGLWFYFSQTMWNAYGPTEQNMKTSQWLVATPQGNTTLALSMIFGAFPEIPTASEGVNLSAELAETGTIAIADDMVVVHGGETPPPEGDAVYSGAVGYTAEAAGQGVPNGKVQITTAGDIRKAGGEVTWEPELAADGKTMNYRHVNIRGGQSTFSRVQENPALKPKRIPGKPKPPKPRKQPAPNPAPPKPKDQPGPS